MIRANHSITFLAGKYISHLFTTKLSSDLVFHNFHHTSNVVQGIQEIANHLQLNNKQKEILVLAAWFHDCGHVVKYMGHEKESQQLAEEWLAKENYPKNKIEQVVACIGATLMPQQPRNLLQAIICDADLYHLSLSEYCHLQFQLREEWRRVFQKEYSDMDWMEENLSFLNQHVYFTDYGKTILEEKKKLNLKKCRQLVTEYEHVL